MVMEGAVVEILWKTIFNNWKTPLNRTFSTTHILAAVAADVTLGHFGMVVIGAITLRIHHNQFA